MQWNFLKAFIIGPLATIMVTGTAPAGTAAVTGTGSFRRDVYLKQFPEQGCKAPIDGRRVNIILSQVQNLEIDSVKINGQEGLNLDNSSSADLTYFDWFRAHGNTATKELWLSFHTRNKEWFKNTASLVPNAKNTKENVDELVNFKIDVTASGGTVIASGLQVPCPENSGENIDVTYVTTRSEGTEAVLHISNPVSNKNTDALHENGLTSSLSTLTISDLTFDGTPFTSDSVAPSLPISLPSGSRVTVVVPLTDAKKTGDVWTMTLTGSSANNSQTWGFGGRVVPERFPIMAWPTSTDCPVPGGNQTTFHGVQSMGIDSVFYSGKDFHDKCGHTFASEIDSWSSDSDASFHAFSDDDTATQVTNVANIDAVFIGDEVDGDVDAEHLRKKLKDSLDAVASVPGAVTYQGSKTNHNVGAFAGMTDIQGSDAYCAACAPTMLAVVHEFPIQYPFFYLNNARENHKPLPMWGYSQLYSKAWSYQANSNELVVEVAQTALSGSKALMLFQSNQAYFDAHDSSRVGDAIKMVRTVSDILREGDVDGFEFQLSEANNKKVMVGVIRSPQRAVVIVVNTAAHGYSNLLCHTMLTDRHWSFVDHTLDSIDIHTDSAVGVEGLTDWQEVVAGGAEGPLQGKVEINNSTAGVTTISHVELQSKFPIRFFTANTLLSQ